MATELGNQPAEAATAPASPAPQRLRLGFLTHLHIGEDAADSYRIALELFEAADQMGYDSGWVAQHHFLNGAARMPSSLAFLAAVAQRTRRIHLGTAIIILPLEDPLRVAEDAAVVDTLSGGRLELGLGTGGDPLTFAAFGKDPATRRERFAEGVRVIQDALAGNAINGTAATLYPPAPALQSRLWESTLSREGGARVGRNGNGLLLARTAFMSNERTDVDQLPVTESYLESFKASVGGSGANGSAGTNGSTCATSPRVGLSRAVYPADDRKTAAAHLEAGVSHYVDEMVGRGFFPKGLTQEQYFDRTHIHYGHPEQVIASLRTDLILPHATELIVQMHPGLPTPAQVIKGLERIARDVAPALGWQPQSATV